MIMRRSSAVMRSPTTIIEVTVVVDEKGLDDAIGIESVIIRHEGGQDHIYGAEGKYQFNKKLTLRAEAQYLATKQDEGDWTYGSIGQSDTG